MIALICLFVPSLALVFIREKIFHNFKNFRGTFVSYLLGNLLINGLMILILYFFFNNHGQLIFKLNRYQNFACKYFALSLVLAVAEPFIEKLFRKLWPTVKLHFMRAWEFIKWTLKKMYCAIQFILKKWFSIVEPFCRKVRVRTGWQIKTAVFLVIGAVLLGVCSFVAQPVWTSWNNYNTTHGFYEEPENTIETIFLGASIVVNGIIPMQLYEDYGICAYNLGTESQPMLASYYWLEEAYRLHSVSLDTVVLDVSMLRRTPSDAAYNKALDSMQFSNVKLRAMMDYSDDFDEMMLNLSSLLSYHERWKSLTEEDFLKFDYAPADYTRGYNFVTTRKISGTTDYSAITTLLYQSDEEAEEQALDTESLYYLKKMISFCEEHDIRLVLIKTPVSWSSAAHNAVQKIADDYGLDFLDFNVDPYLSDIDYNVALDSTDNTHPNYYGAVKLTAYLGAYLTEECGNRDVRGVEKYSFLEDELLDYRRSISLITLEKIADPSEYLAYALEQDDYAIFISVKDEAAGALTTEQKQYFESVGLTQLANLTYRASYLAVIDDGEVIVELNCADPGASENDSMSSDENTIINDMENIEEIYEQEQTVEKNTEGVTEEVLELNIDGTLSDGTEYTLISGGYHLGNTSSILIGSTECSKNTRGLNIVVYDKVNQKVVDSASFDTCISSEREIYDYEQKVNEFEKEVVWNDLSGTDLLLYQYSRACSNKYFKTVTKVNVGDDGLLAYLSAACETEGYEIYISVKEEAAYALTNEVREALADMGLEELSELTYGDAYLAVIKDGVVLMESRDHGDTAIKFNEDGYCLLSGGYVSGNTSSIEIDGTEYSQQERGINIVIFDTYLETVVDSVTFDTHKITPSLAEKDENE